MEKCVYNVETTIVGEVDGSRTYEVRKRYNYEGRTAVVIALYPTVSLLNSYVMDNSTLFLLNHAKELGYSTIRILNIFPNVFKSKPLVKQLRQCDENMTYIESVLDGEKGKGTDVIIAWGTSLKSNETVNVIKGEIIDMVVQKGMEKNLRQFTADSLDVDSTLTPHMLWLGLHCKETWYVEGVTAKDLGESIGKTIIEKEEIKKPKVKSRAKSKESK